MAGAKCLEDHSTLSHHRREVEVIGRTASRLTQEVSNAFNAHFPLAFENVGLNFSDLVDKKYTKIMAKARRNGSVLWYLVSLPQSLQRGRSHT